MTIADRNIGCVRLLFLGVLMNRVEDFPLFFGANPNRCQSLTDTTIGANQRFPIGS